jgi:hypothetical protein
MESKEKEHLVRIVSYEGSVDLDLTGRAKGRGAYLCKDNDQCWNKAYKRKALERSLGVPIDEQTKERLFQRLEEINERK